MQSSRRWMCVLGLLGAGAAAEDPAPVPVTIITRAELEASGRATLGEALALRPENGAAALHDGSQRIDLRGLGVQRTLVLINGRRMVPGGGGADRAVDLSAIPLAVVERVEILQAGGSTIYGSDAVGGVVNIITRGGLDGSTAMLYAGAPADGGESDESSAITGFGFARDRGHLMFAAGRDRADPILAADRMPGVASSTSEASSSRYYLSSEGRFALAPAVTVFYEASYLHRSSAQPAAAVTPDAVVLSKDSIYNPFGRDVFGYRRSLNFDGRTGQDVDTWRVVAGLRGAISDDAPVLAGWGWELSYNHGRTAATSTGDRVLLPGRLALAVGPSFLDGNSTPRCGTPSAPIAGCVPFDLLSTSPAIDPAVRAYLSSDVTNEGSDTQQTVLGVLHGQVAALPDHGALSAAIGGEVRRERGEFTPDPLISPRDPVSGAIVTVPDTQEVIEGFGELSLVPFRGKPFAELLALDLSARAFSYDTTGSSVTWQAGALYQPIAGLSLRASYGTAFHAPSVDELYGATDLGMTRAVRTIASAETATIATAGVTLQPRWIAGLTVDVGYWRIAIDDGLAPLTAGEILASCYERGIQASCELIHRDPEKANQIDFIDPEVGNTGRVETSGIDLAVGYDQAFGAFGRLHERFAAQRVLRYHNTIDDASLTAMVDRSDLQASWASDWFHPSGLGVGAMLRYIAGGEVASDWYDVDLRASFTFSTVAGKTVIAAGVNNLLDRDPGSAVAASYDPIGRLIYLRASQAY